MGMAASQARFLSLTARKSNVEYEGQQINQERTALANESSNLYAQLSKMDVPTPPNTSDFYKTVYTFTTSQLDGESAKYTVENLNNTPDGLKAVLSHKENYFDKATVSYKNGGTIGKTSITDADKLKELNFGSATATNMVLNLGGNVEKVIYSASADKHSANLSVLDPDGGENPFIDNSNADDPQVYFYLDSNNDYVYLYADDIAGYSEALAQNPDGNPSYDVYSGMKIAEESKTVIDEYDVVETETNNVGRTTSMIILVPGEDGKNSEIKFDLECTSVQDEAAYHQAMLDYEYDQAKYEKAMTDLNAKTEKIQVKDKTLELELKQLDTEQNAISTEMDAVTKVVEDNVEKTFKTFA